jgi:hypothetical protein
MFIKPWSKESENILKQISLYGKAFTKDTKSLPIQFGHRCKNIINQDLLDIATIRNKREKRTWFITPPDIIVVPKYGNHGVFFHFRRNKFL